MASKILKRYWPSDIISFLIKETYVFTRTTLFRVLKVREQDIIKGSRQLIVFIEGYGGNWPSLGISEYLKNKDLDIIFLDYKTLQAKTMSEYVVKIDDKLKVLEKKYQTIKIVGYSLGGIAALNYVSTFSNNIKTIITISTPYAGSYFSYMPFMETISKDMKPGSLFLERIQSRSQSNKAEVWSLQPKWDQLAIFLTDKTPDYIEEIKTNAIGHNSNMRIQNLAALLERYLIS